MLTLKQIAEQANLSPPTVAKAMLGRTKPGTRLVLQSACPWLTIPDQPILTELDLDPVTVARVLLGEPCHQASYDAVRAACQTANLPLPPERKRPLAEVYTMIEAALGLSHAAVQSVYQSKPSAERDYDAIEKYARENNLPAPPERVADTVTDIAYLTGLSKRKVSEILEKGAKSRYEHDLVVEACNELQIPGPPEFDDKGSRMLAIEQEIRIHEMHLDGCDTGEICRELRITPRKVQSTLEKRHVARFLKVVKHFIFDRRRWAPLWDDSHLAEYAKDSWPPELTTRILDVLCRYGWLTKEPLTLTDDGDAMAATRW